MTLLLGLLAKDGVVVAADGAATLVAGGVQSVARQPTQKIEIIDNSLIVALTGDVGTAQQITHHLRQHWGANGFRGKLKDRNLFQQHLMAQVSPILTLELQNHKAAQQAGHRGPQPIAMGLVAVSLNGVPTLFQFDGSGHVEAAGTHLPFVSMGSGQLGADPFLGFLRRVFCRGDRALLPLRDAHLMAIWCLQQVIETNPGGVAEPIAATELSMTGVARMLSDEEISEHREMVDAAEDYLAAYSTNSIAPPPPPPPRPPT